MKLKEIAPIIDYNPNGCDQYTHYIRFSYFREDSNTWQTDYKKRMTCASFLEDYPEYENAEVEAILPESKQIIEIYIKGENSHGKHFH